MVRNADYCNRNARTAHSTVALLYRENVYQLWVHVCLFTKAKQHVTLAFSIQYLPLQPSPAPPGTTPSARGASLLWQPPPPRQGGKGRGGDSLVL